MSAGVVRVRVRVRCFAVSGSELSRVGQWRSALNQSVAIGSNSVAIALNYLGGLRCKAQNYLGGWQLVRRSVNGDRITWWLPLLHYNPDQSNGPDYQSAALRRHYPLHNAPVLMQCIVRY